MRRITLEDLDHVVDTINTMQGIPLEPWTRVDDKLVKNAWNYHLCTSTVPAAREPVISSKWAMCPSANFTVCSKRTGADSSMHT